MLVRLSDRIQLLLGVSEVGVDFESGFELLFRFRVQSSINHHLTEFVVSHIVIRTKDESLAIEGNRLFTVVACLSFLEVFAKRAIAVSLFLILKLLPR